MTWAAVIYLFYYSVVLGSGWVGFNEVVSKATGIEVDPAVEDKSSGIIFLKRSCKS